MTSFYDEVTDEESKTLLEEAIGLASHWHYDQRDKSDYPYIMHPLRVMLKGTTWNQRIVGMLHDIVEDTPVTIKRINAQFGDTIAQSIVCITHLPNEPNQMYLARVCTDLVARQVKIYDIEDNLSPERMANLDRPTQERLRKKYNDALEYLVKNGPPVQRHLR
jgi:(p)ppGpp synthase/HD superfamily hydrolase